MNSLYILLDLDLSFILTRIWVLVCIYEAIGIASWSQLPKVSWDEIVIRFCFLKISGHVSFYVIDERHHPRVGLGRAGNFPIHGLLGQKSGQPKILGLLEFLSFGPTHLDLNPGLSTKTKLWTHLRTLLGS